jgi:ANTAR domain
MFGHGRMGSGFAIWMFAGRTVRGRGFAGWWPLAGLSVRGRPVAGGCPLPWFWPVRLRGRSVSVTCSVCRPGAAAGHLTARDRRRPGLRVALASRDVIGQAKGALMERFQISSDEAFRMLVRWSQNCNVKLRAVAAQLVWSGELPMGGGASRRTAQGAAGSNASGLLCRPARAGRHPRSRIEAQV